MTLALIIAAALSQPATQVVPVDVCEINHVHGSELFTYRFTQIILWRFHSEQNDFRVAQYQVVRPGLVHRDRARVTWFYKGREYSVKALQVRESRTCGDPEMMDRKKLPINRRERYWK